MAAAVDVGDPFGPRWLLFGDVGFGPSDDDIPLALCADIDGLFVDLPPRPREHFTLVGCTPTARWPTCLTGCPPRLSEPSEPGWVTSL